MKNDLQFNDCVDSTVFFPKTNFVNIIKLCTNLNFNWKEKEFQKINTYIKGGVESFQVSRVTYRTVCGRPAVLTVNSTEPSPGLYPESQWDLSCSLNHITVIQTCCCHKHTCVGNTYCMHILCRVHSTSLREWRRVYGSRKNMNNVRKEQTPLWFQSTETLINRNVFGLEPSSGEGKGEGANVEKTVGWFRGNRREEVRG